MKKKLLLVGITWLLVFGLSACSGGETAEQTVSNALDAMVVSDMETAAKYFGSEEFNAEADIFAGEQGELLKSVFERLTYKIISSEELDDTATVTAEITNTNMEKIFPEFMAEILVLAFSGIDESEIEAKTIELWAEILAREDSEMLTTTVDIQLVKVDETWEINADEMLMNALLGGFLTAMSALA